MMTPEDMRKALKSIPTVDRYLALVRKDGMLGVVSKCLEVSVPHREAAYIGGNIGWVGEDEFEFMGIRIRANEEVPEGQIVFINLSKLERDSLPSYHDLVVTPCP